MRRRLRLSRQQVLAGLLCLCAVTAAVTTFLPRVAGVVRAGAGSVLAPFGDASMYLATAARRRVGRPEMVSADVHEELRREADFLRARIAGLEQRLRDQQDRLRQARTFARLFEADPPGGIPYRLIPARVVARQSLPYGRGGAVNVGSAGGALAGAPVTTRHVLTRDPKALLPEPWGVIRDEALVGRISETWAFGARLALVTDPGCRVAVHVHRIIRDPDNPRQVRIVREGFARSVPLSPRNNAPIEAIAEGARDGSSVLVREVRSDHNVLPGDVVITRPGAYLPAWLLVGKVAEVSEDVGHAGFVRLRVEPAADLDALRRVYIVKPLRPKERL
ncbi:MAG: rod shape-determining protein MreC [Planctomycetota bacterium]